MLHKKMKLTDGLALLLVMAMLMSGAVFAQSTQSADLDMEEEWQILFHVYGLQIMRGSLAYDADRVYNEASLIKGSDRHPVDVVVRRTEVMLEDLAGMPDFKGDADAFRKRLGELQKAADALPPIKKGSLPEIHIKVDKKDIDGPPLPKAGDGVDMGEYRDAFVKACELNREIALANPLLDFDKILFVKKHPPRMGHMCDQWFGMVQDPGGGLYVLENPGTDKAQVRNLTDGVKVEKGRLAGKELHRGVFASPEVTYDGKTIWFAYSELQEAWSEKWEKQYRAHLADPDDRSKKVAPWGGALFKEDLYIRKIDDAFHLMKINADGTGLVQVTDGAEDDHSPCVLPNGRVAFVSTRRGGEGRCHPRPCPSYVLHTMLPDGSDIQPLSYHEINEWTPRVNNDGDIVYSRWDYVDRNFSDGQHPWIIKQDGRNSQALYGNYENNFSRGHVQEDLRAIPDSPLYVGTYHSHHCSAYGSLLIYDETMPDDPEQSCIKALTPDTKMEPSLYASPYPLNENYFLCVYSPDSPSLSMNTWRWDRPPTPHGIYLLDAYGNRTLLYRDDEIASMVPLPLASREMPPVQPHQVAHAYPPGFEPDPKADPTKATFACMNVYDSQQPWPEDRKITSLRIVQVYPKTTPRKGNPPVSWNVEVNTRGVIGTVPIEEDGSCHFEMPVGKPVYFQVLDENGLAIQSMKSSAYAMPGETLTCQGCHEPKTRVAETATKMPLALQRPPSKPVPGPEGSYPLSFPRLVQPVLDKKCVPCHEKKDAVKLDGNRYKWYTHGYENLKPFAWCLTGQGHYIGRPKELAKKTSPVISIPGEVGATESRLYPMLTTGSHKDRVKLTDEEMMRITMWLDNFSVFYSAYDEADAQKSGKLVVPWLE
ncbi:MAG: hypothetical protein ACLFUS_12960 [Candidatus Sumerlaeia bacterium]